MRAITGYVDADGRLIAGDDALLALHQQAGGAQGGELAIPQLASLARIARSLAIPVSRPVTLSDEGRAVEVLVRAQLDNDLVKLSVSDLHAGLPVGDPIDEDDPARAESFAKLEGLCAWQTDASLNLTQITPALSVLFGSPGPDAMGKALGSVFIPCPGPDGAMPILAALVHQAAFAGQWAMAAGFGDRQLLIAADPIEDHQGMFQGYVGTAQLAETAGADTTGARTAGMSNVAQRLDTALRGTIARIVDNADAIHAGQEAEIKPEYQGYAADISAAGRHLLGLVDDLTDLQAIERPDFKIEAETIDLADLARRASGLLAVRAADRRVRIDKPDEDEILLARGEYRRVLQILVNLIGNAIRYSPEDSMVWIRTEQDGGLAVVIVADQGKGIALTDQPRIFEKFERVDTTEPGGSGLGLYIARRLARAMGGDVTVDSAPGLGARFALTLPTRVFGA